MKNKIQWLAQAMAAITGALMIMMCSSSEMAAQIAKPLTATVVHSQGHARYSSDGRTWQSLKKGTVIGSGCLIQTGDKSTVEIMLADEKDGGESPLPVGKLAANVFRIAPNSVLAIDRLGLSDAGDGTAQEVQLDLRAGELSGNVEKSAASSKYEIKFAKGVVGIRDGAYRLDSQGTLSVSSGTSVISGAIADGSMVTRVVKAGQWFDPATGLVGEAPAEENKSHSPAPMIEQPPARTTSPTAPGAGGMGGALRRF